MAKIFKNSEIELIAEDRLRWFEENNKGFVKPPIPIDRIIDDCDFGVLYEKIDEHPGEKILGGLNVEHRIIILNETHLDMFKQNPGLERFTKAHELGHWDIYLNRDENKTIKMNFDVENTDNQISYRNSKSSGKVSVIANAWIDNEVYCAYREIEKRKDHPNVASAVNRYASSILMPKQIIQDIITGKDLLKWKTLYGLTEVLDVTISALCVRLQRLGLIYVKNKKLYRDKDGALGQTGFEFE